MVSIPLVLAALLLIAFAIMFYPPQGRTRVIFDVLVLIILLLTLLGVV
jgi:hypothetical protein